MQTIENTNNNIKHQSVNQSNKARTVELEENIKLVKSGLCFKCSNCMNSLSRLEKYLTFYFIFHVQRNLINQLTILFLSIKTIEYQSSS